MNKIDGQPYSIAHYKCLVKGAFPPSSPDICECFSLVAAIMELTSICPQSTNDPKFLYESEEVIVVTIKISQNLYLTLLRYFTQFFRAELKFISISRKS